MFLGIAKFPHRGNFTPAIFSLSRRARTMAARKLMVPKNFFLHYELQGCDY